MSQQLNEMGHLQNIQTIETRKETGNLQSCDEQSIYLRDRSLFMAGGGGGWKSSHGIS